MSARPIIPGLVQDVYTAGSRHSAATPRLVRSDVADGKVDFEWKASGSSTYTVTAKGAVVIAGYDERGGPRFDSDKFRVECSCPSGEEQRTDSIGRGKLYVCKHATAALESVLDRAAAAKLQSERQGRAAEAKRLAVQHEAKLEVERKIQDEQLPGERDRIEYGLSKLSPDDVVKLLKTSAQTVKGLKALVDVFPTDVMPPQKQVKCGRCGKDYDPRIASDRLCQIEHPYEKVSEKWDTSKKSWSHCRRCGKDFGLDGFHSWGKRRRDDPEDEGEYCYEGVHVPEGEYELENDPGMQFDDEGDY